MTISAFTRLQRVLDLEEKQGWRNRGVIGGLQAMSERWAKDANEETAAARVVDAVKTLMLHYHSGTPTTRPALAEKIRQTLTGDLVVLEQVVASAAQPTLSGVNAAIDAGINVSEDASVDDWEDEADYEEEIIQPTPLPKVRERPRRPAGESSRSARDLQSSPTILPGVGPAVAEQLARLEIHHVQDLLWHLPTRHEDFSQLRTISQLQPGEQVTIIANLWEVRERKIGLKREMLQGILADGTGTLHATWWNKWIKNQLTIGTTMRFSGKVGLYMGQKTLDNPVFEDIDDEMVATGRLSPVYPLTEGLGPKRLRNLIRQTLDDYVDSLSDPLPKEIRDEYQLPELSAALYQAHFPDDHAHLAGARKRLAFEEFFYLQLGVQQRRREMEQCVAPALPSQADTLATFTAALPFALTAAQTRVLNELALDLQRSMPMTRLVQGDVGSGKTAVAAGAMWIAACNGAQSALLAPTQILAEQHHRSLSRMLGQLTRPDGTPLQVALLTGRVTGAEREGLLAALRAGEIDVMVGTTALIQEGVEFNQLAFVVVDEQHRFGVEQRGVLRNKANQQPHLLVMSATPIPRSLALTVYGDLDVQPLQ